MTYRLYLDEDVPVVLMRLLRYRGFDALTALDADKLQRSDAEQMAFAVEQRRILLTHNRDDFVELFKHYLAENRPHSGILIAIRRPPYAVADRVSALLTRLAPASLDNQLLYA